MKYQLDNKSRIKNIIKFFQSSLRSFETTNNKQLCDKKKKKEKAIRVKIFSERRVADEL